MPKSVPTMAFATVVALVLYVLTFGLLGPLGACLRTAATASAAPSPTCGGDLRECLRKSADMRQTTFGGRYVTAEDVARCTEIFNACIHGGASQGGNQGSPPNSRPSQGGSPTTPTSTSTPKGPPGTAGGGTPIPPPSTSAGGSRKGLPTHFEVRDSYGTVGDCRVSGDAVKCALSWATPEWVGSGTVTGTLSGLTVTGTQTLHQTGQNGAGCTINETYTGPITYVFNSDGTVKLKAGPAQRQSTFSCADPTSGTTNGGESDGTWLAIG